MGSANFDAELFCSRCGIELVAGIGDFYLVRIQAIADPTPPSFSDEDFERDVSAEFGRLMEQLRDLSAQEAMDQVYRQLVLYLCGPCYRRWIEDPVGIAHLVFRGAMPHSGRLTWREEMIS